MATQTSLSPIASNVVVAMGSSSTQGFYFDYYGKLVTLFATDFPTPPSVKMADTVDNRNHLLSFLNYLYQFVHADKKVVFVNSIGYSIDGGKKKGAEIGIPYSLVDDISNFADTKFVGMLSDIVNDSANHHLQNKFVVVNRNYKTSDGQEISGQWTKRIRTYLFERAHRDFDWVVDLGGKSGTLYKIGVEKGEGDSARMVYNKIGSFFADRAPNDLIKTSLETFIEALIEELQLMVSTHGVVLANTAILQTGKAREQQIEGIFSREVGYHNYLAQTDESLYEAIDFCDTVLKGDSCSGFNLYKESPGVMNTVPIAPWCMWDACTIM
jgi:hypothetical protein